MTCSLPAGVHSAHHTSAPTEMPMNLTTPSAIKALMPWSCGLCARLTSHVALFHGEGCTWNFAVVNGPVYGPAPFTSLHGTAKEAEYTGLQSEWIDQRMALLPQPPYFSVNRIVFDVPSENVPDSFGLFAQL